MLFDDLARDALIGRKMVVALWAFGQVIVSVVERMTLAVIACFSSNPLSFSNIQIPRCDDKRGDLFCRAF